MIAWIGWVLFIIAFLSAPECVTHALTEGIKHIAAEIETVFHH